MGVLLRDTQAGKGNMATVGETYCQYNFLVGALNYEHVTDQDIRGHFDPPIIPPRVEFRMEAARMAAGKEVTDLLKVEKGTPPDMVEIRMVDVRYRHFPRIPSTLVVKRKSVDLYKGRFCTRGISFYYRPQVLSAAQPFGAPQSR